MARAIWLALAFAALASGARYVDYSGVKMPEYGGGLDYEAPREPPSPPADDYHHHGHDATANLDYNEEESVNTEQPKVVESEEWQKPVKKQRKSLDDPTLENVNKYSPEEIVPKYRTSNRLLKHRQPRVKSRNSERDNLIVKRPTRHGRYRKEEMSDETRNVERNIDEFQEDDENVSNHKRNYMHRATTLRTMRRKPRDRFMVPDSEIDEDVFHERMLRRRPTDKDNESRERERPLIRRPVIPGPSGPLVGSDTDSLETKLKLKNMDEYADYYDMKRVQGIKEKLPELIRRTTTSPHRADERPQRRKMPPVPVTDFYPDEQDKSKDKDDSDTEATPPSTTTTTTTTTTTPSTASSQIILKLRIKTTPQPSRNVTLSFAEKSRLSILKKAQRKEMVKGEGTLKPPVLMQVTDQVHTLVIIEPPTSEMPWKNAREVSDDTPDQLKKVKRMMRHKLVNNARNIHDLTENWDDMVCDYIDTSLLTNHATSVVQDVIVFILSCGYFILSL